MGAGGCSGGDEETRPSSSGMPLKRNVCCTDILFLILFVAFWAGTLYIAAFAITQGNAYRLVYGYDSFGNTCNRDKNMKYANLTYSGLDMAGKANVFFFDYLDAFDSLQVCVSICPNYTLRTKEDVKKFAETTGSKLCRYDIPIEDYTSTEFSKWGPCPDLPVPACQSLLNRCIPDPTQWLSAGDDNHTMAQIEAIINADDIYKQVLSDVYTSWKEMIYLCLIALGIAFIMVIAIRFLAAILIYLVSFLAIVGTVGTTAFMWWTYYDVKNDLDRAQKNLDIPIFSVDIKNELAFLIGAIIVTVLTVILLLVIFVMRKRVELVITLFGEAGKCLGSIPMLLIQPLWTFIILFFYFVVWIIIMGYISTAGTPVADADNYRLEYEDDTWIRFFWWYHVIGLIWNAEFILACQQMVISGTVVQWYFTRDKKSLSCTVGKATSRLILHHIGSVALGSFVIVLVKLPRLILMYIQKKLGASKNVCAQGCIKACMCCLWCLEKLLKFLNQNAYTVIAIEGKNFCSAAQTAFSIIASNVLRVAAINSVGDFVLFLGKVSVVSLTAVIGIFWLKENPNLHYYAIPVLLSGLFAFFIAHCFLTIYEMVVDTLLLCFCEDCQINDGSDQRPYFMSASLMKLVKSATLEIQKEEGTGEVVDGPGEDQPMNPSPTRGANST